MGEPKFYDLLAELDNVVRMAPSSGIVARFSELAADGTLSDYAFDHLTCPDWIKPLHDTGYFVMAPPPIRDETEGTIAFPSWAQSRYLARMASKDPDLVMHVIMLIPETNNVRVHEDLAEACLHVPPGLAALWARKEVAWVRSQKYLYMLLPEMLGKLFVYLAQGGRAEAALDLARALLGIVPDPAYAEKESQAASLEPRARFDLWEYEQILLKEMVGLVSVAGLDALKLLCDLLDDALRLSRRPGAVGDPTDYSFIWRPAIERQNQEHATALRDALVTAVLRAAESLAPANGKVVLEIVEGHPYKLFQRIGLHLRRTWPALDPEGTSNLILDPAVLDDQALHHELYFLLHERLDSLPDGTKPAYLALVARGPAGEGLSASDVRLWQHRKLGAIEPFLDGEWKARLEALKAEFGEPEQPGSYAVTTAMWVGPTSPKSAEELRAMSVDDIVSFLQTWKPPGDEMSPSTEGLGRELAALVATEPERFAADAVKFQCIYPPYIGDLLSGFREAAKQNRTFPWPSVLSLCRHVVEQPQDTRESWMWARRAIADLMSVGFEKGVAEMPFDLRSAAWETLSPLTDDPEPTPEYEAQYGGSNMDPATLSINTTRGAAMHAVMLLALWVRRHIEMLPEETDRAKSGFDEMPEVRELLDCRLDPARDPSAAIRSVYGRWFPWLVWLDAEWARQRVSNIFPTADSLRPLRDAAWVAYLAFSPAYDNVFKLLHVEYRQAIDRLGSGSRQTQLLADPDEKLAEHLMAEYWRDGLELDEPEGLLERFYQKASPDLRKHALAFVGRSLKNTEGEVDQQFLERLKRLWEKRVQKVQAKSPPDSESTELAAFGWWFSCAKFDNEWAVEQLKQALTLAGTVDVDHLVAEQLEAISSMMPLAVVECLRLMVQGDMTGRAMLLSEKHAQAILRTALSSGEEPAQLAAVDLIHRLGARGYFGYRSLLPPHDDAT